MSTDLFEVDKVLVHSSKRLATVKYVGNRIAVLEYTDGIEFVVHTQEPHSWVVFDPFSALQVNDPVWVRDFPDKEWEPRHYAGQNRYITAGRTSHSVSLNHDNFLAKTCRANYWKTDEIEWADRTIS